MFPPPGVMGGRGRKRGGGFIVSADRERERRTNLSHSVKWAVSIRQRRETDCSSVSPFPVLSLRTPKNSASSRGRETRVIFSPNPK